MSTDQILTAREGAVATVTVNRPAVLNALDALTVHALTAVMTDVGQDDEIRCVVLTAPGTARSSLVPISLSWRVWHRPALGRWRTPGTACAPSSRAWASRSSPQSMGLPWAEAVRSLWPARSGSLQRRRRSVSRRLD